MCKETEADKQTDFIETTTSQNKHSGEQTKTNNVIPVQDFLELRWMLKIVLSLDGYIHIDETEIVEAVIRCKNLSWDVPGDHTPTL